MGLLKGTFFEGCMLIPVIVAIAVFGIISVFCEWRANKTGNDDWLKIGIFVGLMLGLLAGVAMVYI